MIETPKQEWTLDDIQRYIRDVLPDVQTEIVVSDPVLDSERWLWVMRGDRSLFVVSEDGWAFSRRRDGALNPRPIPFKVAVVD
jgi:hypothetical protein